MKQTKERIVTCVREYKKLFPMEYEAFINSVRVKQDNKVNKYAEFGASDQMVRHLFDVPETLYFIFQRHLRDEEFNWLFSRGDFERKRAGLTWFIKTFPEFKITKDF